MSETLPTAATHASVLRRTLAAVAVLALAALGLAGDAAVPLRDARRAALPQPDTDPFLGVVLDSESAMPLVERIVPGSAAESAGVVPGDVIARIDGAALHGPEDVEAALRARGVGGRTRLALVRGGAPVDVDVTLGLRRRPDDCFRGARFALAVVPLRFANDASHPADTAALTRLLFAKAGLEGSGASLADYYRAQSYGRLDVTGRVLDPVTLPGPRTQYSSQPMGGSPESAFAAAASLLDAREGAAMRGFDGIAFLYAGEPETRPGFALWPHRSTVSAGGRRLPYYVHGTGEPDSDRIGVHCHEFGHLLGLPDVYGAGHVTGSGDFCLMAIGHRGGGASGARSPFSLCAWCRTRLGWMDAVLLDPRTPQRVRLDPVGVGRAAAVVPLSPRTDEYLLLEVRRREGFDSELPSAGLLVWHVGGAGTPGQGRYGNYVNLVAAHGLDCVDAALVRTGEIAFPTARAKDATPETFAGMRTSSPDGFPAYLTSIEALPGGSVAVTLGVARRVVQTPPAPFAASPPDDEGYLVRTDPITGRSVKLFVGPGEGAGLPQLPVPIGGEERR
jgi:M6 family metalloprotease-like protein